MDFIKTLLVFFAYGILIVVYSWLFLPIPSSGIDPASNDAGYVRLAQFLDAFITYGMALLLGGFSYYHSFTRERLIQKAKYLYIPPFIFIVFQIVRPENFLVFGVIEIPVLALLTISTAIFFYDIFTYLKRKSSS